MAKNWMEDLLPKKYLKELKEDADSQASVLYELYESDALLFPEEIFPDWEPDETEQEFIATISRCKDPAELARNMRKELPALSRAALLRRVLAFEKAVMPIIQARILTSLQDVFIDNVSALLLYVSENPSPWIMEHYEEVRSPFMQSMLCAVLGMRGTPKHIPFLKEQVERLGALPASEDLAQGPIAALGILQYWDPEDMDWDETNYSTFSEDLMDEDALSVEVPDDFTEEDADALLAAHAELKAKFEELMKEQVQLLRNEYDAGVSLARLAVYMRLPEEEAAKVLGI